MKRSRDLDRLAQGGTFDLLVIGGGAAGAAVLRSAALCGLHGALCERADFAAGTTSRSSRLIHGGLRYLEHGHLRLVAEALAERTALIRIAPHLVEPLAIHIPIYKGGRRGKLKVRAGLWLYDRLAGGARLGRSGLLTNAAVGTELGGLERRDLLGVGVLWDARVRAPERLVIENLIDAERLGATAVGRLELSALAPYGDVFRATLTDRVADRRLEVETRTVVNAGGPWVGEVDTRAGVAEPARVQWSRGSHLLFDDFDGGPAHAMLCEAPADGRPFFILPWDGCVLVGTTELPHHEAPEEACATAEEIEYLTAAFAQVWPAARGHAPYASYAGVRPLPVGEGLAAADRRHQIVRHRPAGIFSVVGGKLTTHRRVGDEAAALVLAHVGRTSGHGDEGAEPRELPGAQCEPPALEPAALAAKRGLSATDAAALLGRWGCRAWAVAAGLAGHAPIDGLGGLWPAEIVFAHEHEGASRFEDVLLRRTHAAFAPGLTRLGVAEGARVWAWATAGGARRSLAAGNDSGGGEATAAASPWRDAEHAAAAAQVTAETIQLLSDRFGRILE